MIFIKAAPAIWIISALPALGALLIFLFGKHMRARTAGVLATTMVGAAFLWTIALCSELIRIRGWADAIHQPMWTWFNINKVLQANAGFLFDRVSMVFSLVVTGVGFLIHLYSTGYMRGEEGERRYFAYLNLFVASMLVLVLADNAFFMFLGWEGVGAMSFALIGHYYAKQDNVNAARKAFLVTRLGDVFLLLGVLLVAHLAQTLDFTQLHGVFALELDEVNPVFGATNGTLAMIAGLLLLAGAAGKSAQLPLQTWLPDAMAGPTPVSALIHAATMVTAGVYLIARFQPLYALSPTAMLVVACVGVATALFGASCAIVQTDIKRILAYSTISQIGYMILALGVGAYSLGLFHFFTHAFYKALLFLAAGTVIHSLHGEQNVLNMGGLRKKMPGTYWAMVAGAAALAGIPLTGGFFSKDAVLWSVLTTDHGNKVLYGIGLLTSLLTAIYAFRLIFLVFHGEPRRDQHFHAPHGVLVWPLYLLAFFALFAGFVNIPHFYPVWENMLQRVFGPSSASTNFGGEVIAMLISSIVALGGAGVAWMLYGPKRPAAIQTPATAMEPVLIETDSPRPYRAGWANVLFHGWGIDHLYDFALVRPYGTATRVLAWIDETLIDGLYDALSVIVQLFHGFFVTLQNARLSRYAMMMLFGAAGLCAIIVYVSRGAF